MDDEAKPEEALEEEKESQTQGPLKNKETVFNQKAKFEMPWLWFALILVPVLVGILSSAFPNNDAEEIQNDPVISNTPQNCEFQTIIGFPAVPELTQWINPTNRPMRIMKDNGYKVPPENENRINIFVNPDRIITRIECG